MPYIGEILDGAYQITEQIGKGGAGEIYKAYHLNLHKYVVVKKIIDGFVGTIEARGEVDILKQLHHTGLPQVYNFLMIGNNVYTVMEYIEGRDFKYYLDQGYVFPEQSLWIWLEQLADVLNYLHSHGILHMDIKPGNIMLTNEGNICLIDFNISLSDNASSLVGMSYAYASPEQVKKWNGITYQNADANIALDARSDIYSLGVSFYHMMTKVVPNPTHVGMPPLSDYSQYYSKNLISIVSKMMEVNREKRFQDAAKLKHAITLTQRTKAEKATLGVVFGAMLAAVVILALVMGIMIYKNLGGVSDKDVRKIIAEETLLKSYYEEGEYASVVLEGERFLRSESETVDKVKKSKISILTVLADSYRESGRYNDAIDCYEELLEIEPHYAYYQGLAVSYAYRGDYQAAEDYLKEAVKFGSREEDLLESRAEIAVASGDYGRALELYEQIIQSEWSVHSLRRAGYLSLQAANMANNPSERQRYYGNAISYYEQLIRENCASYNDKINLSTAYEGVGEGEKLMNLLQGLIVEYAGRYEAYFRMSVWKYKEQMNNAPSNRNYSEVIRLMGQAESIYRNSGVKDEQFESFLEVLDGIR
jgi:serine/threonine protein kinase/DNA-binding SARP family transcriptional activator